MIKKKPQPKDPEKVVVVANFFDFILFSYFCFVLNFLSPAPRNEKKIRNRQTTFVLIFTKSVCCMSSELKGLFLILVLKAKTEKKRITKKIVLRRNSGTTIIISFCFLAFI